MNTKLRLASLVGVVAIVAAACGSAAATPAPTPVPTPVPTTAASTTPSTGASTAPSAAPLTGTLTVWESYSSGGGELAAFNKAVKAVMDANAGLTINVIDQPFSDIFNKWQTDVSAGGGTADMFIAPNDNLYSQSAAGVLADLTDKLAGKLDGFSKVATDGSQVGGKYYMVPESLKAVALWYDKSAIATPPATTADLLAAVQAKTVKLGLAQGAYDLFGFTGAFGGTLMDATGNCTADKGGFADAFKYFQDLKAAGAKFYTDGNALKQDFQTGKVNMVESGPWQTADFTTALGDKLAVVTLPAGPTGAKANPFTGTDGFYINPNSKNIDLAVAVALQLVGTSSEQIMTDGAGHIPAAPGVTISNAIVQGFADAAAAGLPRPQSKAFGNYWGPFGDAINSVLDKGTDPTTTVASACKLMNDATAKG